MILLISLFLTNSIVFADADRDPASAVRVQKGQELNVSYGADQFDEVKFRNLGTVYEIQFTDRSIINKTQVLKRAMPPAFAEGKIQKLSHLISKMEGSLEDPRGQWCNSRMKIEKSNAKVRFFCIDKLPLAQDREFVIWVDSIRELFRY